MTIKEVLGQYTSQNQVLARTETASNAKIRIHPLAISWYTEYSDRTNGKRISVGERTNRTSLIIQAFDL